MPKINRYVDISTIDKEAKKDYIDRHSPFVHCESSAKKGEKFSVQVKMGDEYKHPDDFDHYISYLQLWDGETLLAQTTYNAGAQGSAPAHSSVTFEIVPNKSKMNLVAMSYCTKHGLWESDPVEVSVSE
jgi:superoxide reductase